LRFSTALTADCTIIYYSANRESPRFEARILERLVAHSGGLPLITVTQQPCAVGQNICVGPQRWCDHSAYRQLWTGLKAATTPYALAAESDCLYPPDYFTFRPPVLDRCYRYSNVWMLFERIGTTSKGLFWPKPYTEGAQVCGRVYWLDRLDRVLSDHNAWLGLAPDAWLPTQGDAPDKPGWVFGADYDIYAGPAPVVSVRSRSGLRTSSPIKARRLHTAVPSIPLWGAAADLRASLFGGGSCTRCHQVLEADAPTCHHCGLTMG
jgi:hypothetical protein